MKPHVELLESLLQHPGWRLFERYVREEWGPQGVQFQRQLDNALDLADNNAAASQARQVRSGQKVILMLLRWPIEEMARLKRLEPKPEESLTESMSRRGGL